MLLFSLYLYFFLSPYFFSLCLISFFHFKNFFFYDFFSSIIDLHSELLRECAGQCRHPEKHVKCTT